MLGLPVRRRVGRLTGPGQFAYVARTVSDATAKAVKALNLPGIGFLPEPKRFNPDGTLAAPVLGQVGTDDAGLSGLEYQYNDLLAGRPGQARERGGSLRATDPRRDPTADVGDQGLRPGAHHRSLAAV